MMWDKSMCSSKMLQHSLKQYSHINMQIILSDWLWESYWDGIFKLPISVSIFPLIQYLMLISSNKF